MPPRRNNINTTTERGAGSGRDKSANADTNGRAAAAAPGASASALTFQSLQAVYQPKNLPLPQAADTGSQPKENSGAPAGSPPPQPAPVNASPVNESLTAAASAVVVAPGGPLSLFTLNPEQVEVVAAVNPAKPPPTHPKTIYPSDMGPLKPTGKRHTALGLPSGSHIKRRPPSVGRRGATHKGGRPPTAVNVAGGATAATTAAAATINEEHGADVNAYGSPMMASLQMIDFTSPPLLNLGAGGGIDYLNVTYSGQPGGTGGSGHHHVPTNTSSGSATVAGAGRSGATRLGREARPLAFDRRTDPSPAPSRPPRANRRKQPPQAAHGNSAARSSTSATPATGSLALNAAAKYGRQPSDSVVTGTPHREEAVQRSKPTSGAASMSTLASLKRPPSGRGGYPAPPPPSKSPEETVQAYLALCEELGEAPNPDWVAVFVRPPCAFASVGPRDSLDCAAGDGGAGGSGSLLGTPHAGAAFTPKGTTAGPGRSLSGRRPQINSSNAGRLEALGTTTTTTGSARTGTQKRAKSPGTGRAAKPVSSGLSAPPTTTGGGAKRSSSVGRVTSTNRPNISLHSGPPAPSGGGAKTPHGPGAVGPRAMADVYLDRMNAYCEQHLRPFHCKMECLRQRRRDVRHAVERFLAACEKVEMPAASRTPPPARGHSAAAKASAGGSAKDRVRSSTGSTGSKESDRAGSAGEAGGAADAVVASTDSLQDLSRTAQSLTDGLGEVQTAVVRVLLKLGECAAEAHKPLGAATAGRAQPLTPAIPGSEASQGLYSVGASTSSPVLVPAAPVDSSATSTGSPRAANVAPAAAAATTTTTTLPGTEGGSGRQGMPTIPPLGIQDIFNNHPFSGVGRPRLGSGVDGVSGAAAASSLPITPSAPTAPSGFVEFVSQQEREIAEELREVRDTVKGALESTAWVYILDDAILQTPLFCPSDADASPQPHSDAHDREDSRRGSSRWPDATSPETTHKPASGAKRSARAAGGPANRTPHTAAMLFGSPASLGVATTPRSTKAGKAATAAGKNARRKSAGHDESPRSKRNSSGGIARSQSAVPIFAIANDALASHRTDASASSIVSPLHGLSHRSTRNTGGGASAAARPLLVLGGGSSLAAAGVVTSGRSRGTDTLAATVRVNCGGGGGDGSAGNSPNAAKNKRGGAVRTGKADGARMRSASAGTGKRGSDAAAGARAGATPSKGAVGSAAATPGKKGLTAKKSKKPRLSASASNSPVAADLIAVSQLEKARQIWAAVNVNLPTSRETLAAQPFELQPLTFSTSSPHRLALTEPDDGGAGLSLGARGGGADHGPLSVTQATMAPPTIAMSATNVFRANEDVAMAADANISSPHESADEGWGSGADAAAAAAAKAGDPLLDGEGGGEQGPSLAPLAAGERTAKPSQTKSTSTTVEATTPPPKPTRGVRESSRSAESPPSFEPATEPAKQQGRRATGSHDDDGSKPTSPDTEDGKSAKSPPASVDPARKLRLGEAGRDGALLSSPSSSSLFSVKTPSPSMPLAMPSKASASVAEQPDRSVEQREAAAARIAKCWRTHAARTHARQALATAAAALARERQRQVQEGRVRRFLLWALRRQRLHTALHIMRARALHEAAVASSKAASSPAVKSAAAAAKKKGSENAAKKTTTGSSLSAGTAAALAAMKAADLRERERRLAEFVQLLRYGCTAADIPPVCAATPASTPSSPPAASLGGKSPAKKTPTPTSGPPTPAMSSRDRFQQAREQRKGIKGEAAASATGDSAAGGTRPPAVPAAPPVSATEPPPQLPLLANGISTKAIASYNSDVENFEVSVLHRLLRAPQPLLFTLRTAADRYPTVPPMGYARLKEPPKSPRKGRTGEPAPPTESMSPDRDASPSVPRAGAGDVAQDRRAAAADARRLRAEKRRTEEKKAGVFTVPFRKLRKYLLYSALVADAGAEGPLWVSPLLPASASRLPPRAGGGGGGVERGRQGASARTPTAAPRSCEQVIPLSVRYESYIDANELGNATPVVKDFTRPFERWGTAYSMTRRIFTAAAIYAWKLLFSHTPHDDFKQRQLRTEEERQSRLDRVFQRNRMILACYCVRSEREWLREASKDLSFVGQIWNPKKSMDPNDPDLDRHCQETYAFVEDFLFQCFPTANALDDVPPFLVGAGIYFVLKEVFHTSAGDDDGGNSSSATEATKFTARYPELVVAPVDARLADDDTNEHLLAGDKRRRSGHEGGTLTEYQRRTVLAYELVDLIDRMSQWHYASVNHTRKRTGGKEREDKKGSTVVLGGHTTHDDGFFLEDPLGSGDFEANPGASDGEGNASAATIARRDDSQASFDALAATWASAAGEHVARGAAAHATPTAAVSVSHDLRTFVSPVAMLTPASGLNVNGDASVSSLKHHHAPPLSIASGGSTPPARAVLSSSALPLHPHPHHAYHQRVLSNGSCSIGAAEPAGGPSAGTDSMAEVAISRVKLVRVPSSALAAHAPGYDRQRTSLKTRESDVFAALAAMVRSQEKVFDFSCRELAVLYPKRFLVALSEKLCYELVGLRLDLEVCEDLDCVE